MVWKRWAAAVCHGILYGFALIAAAAIENRLSVAPRKRRHFEPVRKLRFRNLS